MSARFGRLGLLGIAALLGLLTTPAVSRAAGPSVLLVGPAGTAGAQYTSIQAAVNAAVPGDWILVAPGVYHEHGSPQAGVLIQKPNIHLRGMNRNGVIVDGTMLSQTQRSGTAPAGSTACSSDAALQDYGTEKDSNGKFVGQNGILVLGYTGDTNNFVGHLADNVSIENLTVCNYLKVQEGGNEIWWNGGDGQGKIGMSGFRGDYISATSTYYKADGGTGSYGIFTSDEGGPGVIDHSYASNMQDSSYYVGACRNCGVVLNHAYAENSALGLSSTNAGGNLLVENGVWTNNRTGLVSNAQNNDDYPSPEYGQCVAPSTSPTLGGIAAGPNSCYVIYNNNIFDNNNVNTPGVGLTSVSAIGTGIELAATQHISIIGNHISNNNSWGVVAHDFPDPESGPAHCHGGIDSGVPDTPTEVCTWFSLGNYVAHNVFSNNGSTGNASNGDVANEAAGSTKAPSDDVGTSPDPNCFQNDTNAGGLKQDPAGMESAPCAVGPSNSDITNVVQLVCATGAAGLIVPGAPPCPGGSGFAYPQHDGVCKAGDVLTPAGDTNNGVCFAPISRVLSASVSPPMPDPCAGVPANAYCNAATAVPTASPSSALPLTAPGGGRVVAIPLAFVLLVAFVAAPMLTRRARRAP
jgi:hypothetical protein